MAPLGHHTDVVTAKEANMQKYTKYTGLSTFADNAFSSFTFTVPVEKIVVDEEELHGIETDGILNLENLSRTVIIDEDCWN